MVSRETVATAARDFLEAVAEVAKVQLGSHPQRVQRSQWMVSTGPGTWSSKQFERKVFDGAEVSNMYQIRMMRDDFRQRQQLRAVLAAAGIPAEQVEYGFFLSLVHHWIELPDPFAFEETAISRVLDEFVNAVVDGRVVTRSLDAIGRLDLVSGPVVLETGVSIRPVTEEELWEFGSMGLRWVFPSALTVPSEEWNILDIELRHERQEVNPPVIFEVIRGAVLTALQLASSGWLRVIDLGRTTNYGMGAVVRARSGGPMPRELRSQGTYVLDGQVAQRLKDSWPRLREIMESQDHYLRLPAQRLMDGVGRNRVEDAIIDYAIGLEALLGVEVELMYRFGLRGATVLAWDGGNKRQFFKELKDFYSVRSSIVHGRHVAQSKLDNAHSVGENALRDVWWWCFMTGTPTFKKVLSIIDDRILE